MSIKEYIKQYRNERKMSHERHRFERERAKAHRKRVRDTHLADLEYPSFNKQMEWISDHMEEESRGFAILQRLARLESKEEEGSEKRTPGKLTILEKAVLLDEFIINNRRVVDHWNSMPQGNTTTAYEMDCDNRDPEHGRRAQWYNERALCAELGGCCGRECGCCEKPVSRYLVHLEEGKEPVSLYGHCTVECGCCIRERGCYVPDARLADIGVGEECI
ncbi:hypothetical protein BDW62DRAFT_174337 [Aspergillus aurantiobrunneus]